MLDLILWSVALTAVVGVALLVVSLAAVAGAEECHCPYDCSRHPTRGTAD